MAINLSAYDPNVHMLRGGLPDLRHHVRIMDLVDKQVVYESREAIDWTLCETNVRIQIGDLKTDVVYLKPGWVLELRGTKVP